MKHFDVAAGILCDATGRVLITERLGDGPFHGLWEFPGGKIAPGESAYDALHRELAEELGIDDEQKEHLKKRSAEIKAELDADIAKLKEKARQKLLRELRPDQRKKFKAQWRRMSPAQRKRWLQHFRDKRNNAS